MASDVPFVARTKGNIRVERSIQARSEVAAISLKQNLLTKLHRLLTSARDERTPLGVSYSLTGYAVGQLLLCRTY